MGKFILGDCMNEENGLPSFPDNHFGLAIVDPPYGIGVTNNKSGMGRRKGDAKAKYKMGDWDNERPNKEYFNQLFRVSKNQIVWGGNYFIDLWQSPCKGFICWYKKFSNNVSFASVELAWTSFDVMSKFYSQCPPRGNRIHPTQKDVKLYQSLLTDFAQKGDLILDTHVGSGSSLIAFESMGFDYIGFEIDPDYYSAVQRRMSDGIQQAIF